LPCRIGPSIRTTKAVRTERYGWMLIVSSAVEDLGDSAGDHEQQIVGPARKQSHYARVGVICD